ncbi:MAG: radical SAM/SPASM domain-containing protein [Nanobdellota archaeon]
MTYTLTKPITAQIEITEECNQKCIFCYNYFRDQNKPFQDMNPEQGKNIIKKLKNIGIFTLTITGGEPFRNRETLYTIITEANKQNIRTGINTNAALINDKDIQFLKNKKISSMLVSLHHPEEEASNRITNSKTHKKTLENIARLQSEGIFTAVNMVTMKNNYHLVYDMGEFLHNKYDISAFSATPISPMKNHHNPLVLNPTELQSTLDDLLLLQQNYSMGVDVLEVIPNCYFSDVNTYQQFMRRTCSAGSSAIAVGSDGQVRPCTHSDEQAGNILEEEFETIWNTMKKWRDKSLYPAECISCVETDYCTSGCRLSAQALTGDIKEKDPYMKQEIKTPREQEKHFKQVQNHQSYSINKEIQVRKEEDDTYTIFDGKTKVNLVNREFLKFTNHLSEKERFKPCEVEYGELNKEEITGLLTMMYNNNYIQESNKNTWNHPNI